MKKKMLHKNHNVAKWPPSATNPWTLTLAKIQIFPSDFS